MQVPTLILRACSKMLLRSETAPVVAARNRHSWHEITSSDMRINTLFLFSSIIYIYIFTTFVVWRRGMLGHTGTHTRRRN